MTRTRYKIHDSAYPHFLTCTIVDWLPVFTRPEAVQVVLDSWSYLQANHRMQLFAYVVLENHLHFIASSDDLAKEVGDFKSYTARNLIDLLKQANAQTLLKQLAFRKSAHKTDREFQLWQEGIKPKQISSDEMMQQKIEYIHNNPVKRGYVDDPIHWRYSSARNYAGVAGLIDVRSDW
ncbi:transposase [Aeoliella sp. ICT_H6.2]|uniref:Transposase n=1 Tax=Aeoliella straminimaris TaxID=2954799 RepID=A0A9X2FFN1_9BACT|nr:transposase [Aeoliella straminimaris]MCO6044856.1 transposase [Aeoliella straminimaris]